MQNLSLLESDSLSFTVDNHLSTNLNDYTKSNFTTFSSLTETKSYTPITGCVLEHILTTTDLTNHEKLYYLLADNLALISKNKGKHRSASLPSEDWATRLGCSRSLIFTMQKSLKKKGYFIINKDWDEIGRNKRNLIIPTLPASVFNHLNEKFPDRVGEYAPYNPLTECKRTYLDRSKLFIKLNYQLLLTITASLYLNPQQKMIWLGFYTRCYKNYMLQGQEDSNVGKYNYNNDSSFSFISSYQELADLYSCNTKHLSKSIRALEGLGFIKTQNFYIRKKYSDNDDSCSDTYGVDNNYYENQERQDQSLWKITLSLPNDCILELEKVKDRSNLQLDDIKVTATDNTIDSNLVEDYLMLGGIKFNLSLEQASLLKSVVNDDVDTTSLLSTAYIDSVMEELDKSDDTDSSDAFLKPSLSLETFDNKEENGDGIKSDPTVTKSGLLLNKDLKLKIKDIKSNLGLKPKVLFNEFLKRFRKDKCDKNVSSKKKDKEFNIYSELIRKKLKELPKDKADKARKFAYSLVSQKLATGYAAGLSKHELAKQLIHHAATWKPTKLGSISRDKETDAALSVAWKAIVGGTWKIPLELAKAEILQHEFGWYRRKYQESGVLSHEVRSLESDVNNLLGGWYDLAGKITKTEGNVENSRIDIDIHIFANKPLSLGLEAKLEFNILDPLSTNFIINSSILDGSKDNCQWDYDYPEMKQCSSSHSISLSHIPEEQKYLKVTPSDEDASIKLEAINGREYFVKLKELEMNDQGEFVMTLKPIAKEYFTNQFIASIGNNVELNVVGSNMAKRVGQDCNLGQNIQHDYSSFKNSLQENIPNIVLSLDNNTALQTKVANTEAVKIDAVIGNIFKNLMQKN